MIVTETDNGFEVKEGGETLFKAVKVTQANNGFTLDIASQTVNMDGQQVALSGYEGATLTSSSGAVTKYDGLYVSGTKKLTSYFQFDMIIDEDTYTVVIEIVGTKQ